MVASHDLPEELPEHNQSLVLREARAAGGAGGAAAMPSTWTEAAVEAQPCAVVPPKGYPGLVGGLICLIDLFFSQLYLG